MADCLETQIGRLRKQAQLTRQIQVSARAKPFRWRSALFRPGELRRRITQVEVSAESAWQYSLALEAQIAQLTQYVKNVEGCLTHLGSARDQAHLKEMIAILRADGLHSLLDH